MGIPRHMRESNRTDSDSSEASKEENNNYLHVEIYPPPQPRLTIRRGPMLSFIEAELQVSREYYNNCVSGVMFYLIRFRVEFMQ